MIKQGLVVCGVLAVCAVQAQVSLGQVDTFDTDTMFWQGANPTWTAGGGPGGAADAFLHLHSTGQGGPQSKMAAYNQSQWSGDFITAGIASIGVDLNNLGDSALVMRIVFFDTNRSTQWESLSSASLSAHSGWQHFSFSLDSSNFVQTEGSTSFASTLSAANQMMFRHNPNPSNGGVTILADLGVDNISANPVPEPASLLVFSLGIPMLMRRRRNR